MRSKMRTIATGFAVASGLFLMIVLQGAGNGLINSFEYNMQDFAFDAINIYGGRTTKPFEGIKEGRPINLDRRDVEMTYKNFSDRVKNVMPLIEKSGVTAAHDGNYASATINGVYPLYAQSQSIKILKGRFINNIDIEQQRKVVVISNRNVNSLFKKSENPINANLNIGGISFKVIGVYKASEMNDRAEFYSPYSTVSTIYNRGAFIDQITMTIQNIPTEEDMDTFMTDYIRASSMVHSFAPDDDRALWIWNQAGDNIQMEKAKSILHNAFWILGLLTLISGVVGVSNIMLISVKERTREFGIRRAIGARPWNVIRMVMMESIVVTAIFGYIGMLMGVLFCEWMDSVYGNQTFDTGFMEAKYFINPTVDISTCVTATVIIIIAGALAGFFPARKAVKIKPIEALRG